MKFRVNKKHILYFIFLIFGLLIFFMGIANHYFFRTVTHDYGNYNFAFWDYAHFRISPIPTFRGNFLQDHFSFTLLYFVPLYWLLNWLTGSYTLIIIQCTLIVIAAWYSYKIIQLKSNNLWLGAGVLAYYFLLFGRYSSFSADVNLAIISSCFIPIFIYYFEIKKYTISFILLILSLFSRENIPLWFIFIFIVLIIEHRNEKKAVLFSLLGIAVSVIYFILLFKVFIPSIESEDINYALFNYSALGATPGETITYIINHPLESVKLFFVNHLDDPAYNGVKAEFYWVYIISGGFMLFFRPQYLIWFIPVVAQKVLNDNYIRWGIATYYSIEVVTLLPLSVFLILAKIKNRLIQKSLVILTCIMTISMTIHKLDASNNKVPWTLNPSKIKVYSKHFYEAPFNIKKVNKLLEQIPPNAKVSASNVLLPHIAQRQYIYFFPVVKNAEYIIFSVFDNNYLFAHQQNEKERNKNLESPDWDIIAKEFPVFLLKKRKTKPIEEKEIIKLESRTDTIYCTYEKVDSVNNLVYFNDSTPAIHAKKIVSDVTRSGSASLLLDPQNPYGTSVKFEDAEQLEYIYVTVWYHSKSDKANIVASYGKYIYYSNGKPESEEPDGWKKLELGFWIPQHLNLSNLTVYLLNSGPEPVYFDDFQIIKRYKN